MFFYICNGTTASTSNPTRCSLCNTQGRIHFTLNGYELFYSSEQCWGSTNRPVKSSASVLWPQMRVSVVSIPGVQVWCRWSSLQVMWSCFLPLEQPRKGPPRLNLKPAATICCCLDRGDAEILRQRKTWVSVTCGFLRFGVVPDVLVPVAGVALQQQLRHTRGGGGVEA